MDETPGDELLVRRLRQVAVENERFIEALGEAHGMHRTDLNAVAVIMDAAKDGRALSPTELANALHLSASATSSLLDRLETAGHIRRDRNGKDRRRVELHVREEALTFGRQLHIPLAVEYQRAWEAFGDDERRIIERFLSATIDATVRAKKQSFPRED
ncbi:MarR family transcriptional regulator [Saccharomonospora sp. NPDC006951]